MQNVNVSSNCHGRLGVQWTMFVTGLLSLLMLTLVLVPSLANAQWSGNPKINNLVCNAAFDQSNAASVTDGHGGVIMAWQDDRNGNYDIYMQRVSSVGAILWAANGVAICTADSDQVNPSIITDEAGGAIVAWQDKRSGSFDIYAQRVNANGTKMWTPSNGDSVCKVVFDQTDIAMVSDGNGGALITWEDYRSNAGPGLADIYAQKLNSLGVSVWTANGIGICTQAAAGQHAPKIACDGFGGAFITWYDQRAGNYDIYAQRITAIGGLVGIADGVAVCTAATDQTNPDICSDGVGGAIIVWQDFRSTTSIDIWVQRLSPAVAIKWLVDGVVMNNNVAYDQINPKIVEDGFSGAIMTWEDYRGGTTADIYAQRVDSTGIVGTGWNVNGIAICVSAFNQIHPNIISDSSHGGIITWIDKRDSATNRNTFDVYAARITGGFDLPWGANGVPVCTADSTQTNPAVVCDGTGGAIIAWQDNRSGNNNIYASRLFQNGTTPVYGSDESPAEFALYQNYPNPFNPSTEIRYSLSEAAQVTLTVYNLLGNVVATLVNSRQAAGTHNVQFNSNSGSSVLSSGVYFYRLQAGSAVSIRKFSLLK